jgi:hypothetical protein
MGGITQKACDYILMRNEGEGENESAFKNKKRDEWCRTVGD